MSSIILNTFQFAPETTAGTAAPALIKPLSTKVMPSMSLSGEAITASGGRMPVDYVNGKEHSEWDISGQINGTDCLYWLAGSFGTLTGTGTSRDIILAQETSGIRTHTFQYVQGATCEQATNCQFTEFSMKFAPETIGTFSGKLIGGKLTDGVTPTASPNRLPSIVFGAPQYSFWLSDTYAGLTSTSNQLLNSDGLLDLEFTIGGIAEPVYAIAEADSFAFHSDLAPTASTKISVVKGSARDIDMLSKMRSGAIKFGRILARYPSGTPANAIDIRFAFKATNPGSGETSGQYHRTYDLMCIYTTDIGSAIKATISGSWLSSYTNSTGVYTETVSP